MSAWPGWGANEDLTPCKVAKDRGAALRCIPTPTMSRRDAISAIVGAVELEDEARTEEALTALGVNPVELFFAAPAGGAQ